MNGGRSRCPACGNDVKETFKKMFFMCVACSIGWDSEHRIAFGAVKIGRLRAVRKEKAL